MDCPTKVRIACIQYELGHVHSFAAFAAKVKSLTGSAAAQGAEFVIFPEFFSLDLLRAAKTSSDKEGLRWIARECTSAFIELLSSLARQHRMYIIGGSHPVEEGDSLFNKAFIMSPDGTQMAQPKLHITPFEKNDWGMVGGNELMVIETPKANIAVQICYDIEFPAASACLADLGVDILFVPYCTDDRQGMLRVRYCAQARAVEHQMVVATAGLVGALTEFPSMNAHDAQSTVHTPSDLGFPSDGIAAITERNIESLLIADVDMDALRNARINGTVTPRKNQRRDLFEIKPSDLLTIRHVSNPSVADVRE